MQQLVLFNYDSLDINTSAFVQEKAQSINAELKRTAKGVIAIGQDLAAVKKRLGHGQFIKWIDAEFGMSERMSRNFMTVAERFRSKSANFANLPVSVLYELAAPSTPDTVIEMVESGEVKPTIPAIREAKCEAILPSREENVTWDEWHQALIPEPEREQDIKLPSRGVPAALLTSESNEWFTPLEYVDMARDLMGTIDIDPASNVYANEKVVHATTYYDIQTNGLDKSWHGRVWLNPPYGRDGGGSNQEAWSRRLIEQYEAGITKEAVLLVNANTEAKWFQPLYNYLVCFTNHRIRFYNTEGVPNQPTQGNAFIYFGNQTERFIELFSSFGTVIRRIDK